MRKKLVGVIFCMLLIIAAIVPVTGKLSIGNTDDGKDREGSTRDWITLPDPLPVDMILEKSVCRRMSFHQNYPPTPVTDEELSTVLWAAYGVTTTGGRTVYSPNGTYSTTIYVIRSDATYIYVAANHSLLLFKTGNYLYIGQDTGAPIKFGLVWNKSIASDERAGMVEIGMIGQNVYFDANALDLATITTGMSVNEMYDLGLPSNEKPEIIMHLGHPSPPYDFTYNPLPGSNLPGVVNNTMTLADAVNTRQIVNEWNNTELTLLEESQTLWCSYGTSYLYDNINHKRHRTLPSAIDIYPFKIFAANQSGVYQYAPTTHSISLIVSGDKREQIQNALPPSDVTITSAPWIILPFWDKNVGNPSYLQWWNYEVGAIIHNVFLEGTALNLSCNVLTVIADQSELRSALGISAQTNLLGMAVIPVGHVNSTSPPNNPPAIPSLSGPASGKKGVLYNYTVSATDVDGDNVSYYINWGDGTNSGWLGPFASGVATIVGHTWANKGTYTVMAKAKDSHDAESGWASLQVKMPAGLSYTPFMKFLERLQGMFYFLLYLLGFLK